MCWIHPFHSFKHGTFHQILIDLMSWTLLFDSLLLKYMPLPTSPSGTLRIPFFNSICPFSMTSHHCLYLMVCTLIRILITCQTIQIVYKDDVMSIIFILLINWLLLIIRNMTLTNSAFTRWNILISPIFPFSATLAYELNSWRSYPPKKSFSS